MKHLCALLLFLVSFSAYGQEFLNSREYVYVCGHGKSIEEADNDAKTALGEYFRLKVSSTATHVVKEENGRISDSFTNRKETYSNVDVSESERFVDENYHKRGEYRVYRYVNKSRYLAKKHEIYAKWLTMAANYAGSNSVHELNLLLGCYYKAYDIIDNDMMDVLDADNFTNKAYLKSRAEFIYSHYGSYGALWYKRNMPDGYKYVDIEGHVGITLYGFEYYDNGDWKVPTRYYDERGCFTDDGNTQKAFYGCGIHTNNKYCPIRFTYEYLSEHDGRFVKIDVPEDWYFKDVYGRDIKIN